MTENRPPEQREDSRFRALGHGHHLQCGTTSWRRAQEDTRFPDQGIRSTKQGLSARRTGRRRNPMVLITLSPLRPPPAESGVNVGGRKDERGD